MTKVINGIKIDVAAKAIYPVTIEAGLAGMRKAIGCKLVDRVGIDNQNDIWFDDEGLFADPAPGRFRLVGWGSPVAGNGLVLGYTRQGDSISTNRTPADFINLIRFYD